MKFVAKTYLSAEPTLTEWGMYWLETYVKPVAKPGGYEHYHDNLCKHIIPAIGDIRLSELNSAIIQRFFNEQAVSGNLRTGGPLSTKSIKNMRVVMDCCCKWAVAEGYMRTNPVVTTVIKHNKTKRFEIMSDSNQHVLEKWLFEHPGSENAAILISLFTGARLGEVCALRWRDYDRENCCVHIHETARRISNYLDDAEYGNKTSIVISTAKTDASDRNLYLPEILVEIVELQYERYVKKFGREPRNNDFIIWNGKGTLMDPDNLSSYFSKTLKQLELPHVKYHALRHTFATRAVEQGIDVATVSGILGHADVTTTTHFYVRPREEAMRRAMASIRPTMAY